MWTNQTNIISIKDPSGVDKPRRPLGSKLKDLVGQIAVLQG